MPFYYSKAADRGHVAEQTRRAAAGLEPLSCPAGCPCETPGPRLPYVCRCGQLSGDARVCDACRARERAPQGEAVRLFQPAPVQLTGQTDMLSLIEPGA